MGTTANLGHWKTTKEQFTHPQQWACSVSTPRQTKWLSSIYEQEIEWKVTVSVEQYFIIMLMLFERLSRELSMTEIWMLSNSLAPRELFQILNWIKISSYCRFQFGMLWLNVVFWHHYASDNNQQQSASRIRVVRLAINTCFTWCDISVLSEGISVKLARNIHYLSGHCWTGFQGQRSKLKVVRDQTR